MPAIQRSEFALALNQVATERGVDIDVVLDTVKNAILAAYRKDHPGTELEEYSAELNPNTGEAKILHNGQDVTPPGFGRIAAQTAKQVILQKIREKEKEAIMTDYKIRVGTVVNGMILRFAGQNIIVDVGKTEAIMPPSEQIPSEKYRLNQRLAFHLLEIREGARGEELIVSRASNGLLEGLFKREVPEVAQGSVEIKAVVREPGNRAKVAVYSNQPGIDPVGSCVGQKGVRIQAIIQETGGMEKIDIIQYQEDPKSYIANALSPAKNVRVEINDEEKVAQVFVPKDQLSLTIGAGGQNVRLASKLAGYRIEVEGEGADEEEAVVEEEKAPESTGEALKEAVEVAEIPQDVEAPSNEAGAKEDTAASGDQAKEEAEAPDAKAVVPQAEEAPVEEGIEEAEKPTETEDVSSSEEAKAESSEPAKESDNTEVSTDEGK